MKLSVLWFFYLLGAAPAALAATPAQILAGYEAEAGTASAARGAQFFRAEVARDGKVESCTDCHTANPKATGKTGAHKPIEPLAPIANRDRLTDPAKVEKWFRRNCRDVLGRECSAQEKADFVAFLIGVK